MESSSGGNEDWEEVDGYPPPPCVVDEGAELLELGLKKRAVGCDPPNAPAGTIGFSAILLSNSAAGVGRGAIGSFGTAAEGVG